MIYKRNIFFRTIHLHIKISYTVEKRQKEFLNL